VRAWIRTMAHIARHTYRAHPGACVAALSLLGAEAVLVGAVALSQRWLVDGSVERQPVIVALAVLAGAAAYAVRFIGTRVRTNIVLYLGDRTEEVLHRELVEAVAAASTIEYLDDPAALDRLERLRSGTWALAISGWQALGTVAVAISLLVTLSLLHAVHPALLITSIFVVPPLLASSRAARLRWRAIDEATEASRREQALHDLFTTPSTAQELYVACTGRRVDHRAQKVWDTASRVQLRGELRALVVLTASWLVYALGLFGTLYGLAGQVRAGHVSFGELVLTTTLLTSLLALLRQLVQEAAQLSVAGSLVRYFDQLRQEAAVRTGGGAPPPEALADGIRLTGVAFRYPGANADVLNEVTLHFAAGSVVALVGVNGAGKSTLVKLLCGLYQPREGTITVDGVPLTLIDPECWRSRTSALFQDHARLEANAGEVVGSGALRLFNDRGAVEQAVRDAGAQPLIDRLPAGLATPLGLSAGGIELSGGEWQRLGFARSLMPPAPLLRVLDEPTAALDPQTEDDLLRRYLDQANRTADSITVVVSHRLATVRDADLIVVLDDGRVVESGSHPELMAAGGRYADLFRIQAAAHHVHC
jgi:ATP-binding cassette, subfamily B, bacterial